MTSSDDGQQARSRMMARIRGRDTSPELVLRRHLWRIGLRYRLHAPIGRSRPDFVFPGPRVAVFLDGCFWHGCPDHYVAPRSSRSFWAGKLRQNVERDRRGTAALEAAGWRVLRVWEHEVGEDASGVARRVAQFVRRGDGECPTQPRVVEVEFLDSRGALERRHLLPLRGDETLVSEVRERRTDKGPRVGHLAEAERPRRERKPRR